MSAFNEIDMECEECGDEFKGIIWTAVHAQQDPELKDLLLGGELNILFCPKCAHVSYQDHFVLYQDPIEELIAYIYPPNQEHEAEFLRKTMLVNFAEAQAIYPPEERKNYDPLLIFGLETFVELMDQEKLKIDQSDVAEAICSLQNIPYIKLRPSMARAKNILRILPSGTIDNNPSRDQLLAGLDRILKENPKLDLYVDLRTTIQKDLQWHVPEK